MAEASGPTFREFTKRYRAVGLGDEIRLLCPLCGTSWNTTEVPAECPTCAAQISIVARKPSI